MTELHPLKEDIKIGFDYSHDNKLIIEDPGFSEFVEYLFNSEMKLGKIEAGITYEKLANYNVFIIGVPTLGSEYTTNEIEDILKYVRDGGSILAIYDKGGDLEVKSNLNEITKHFGIIFNTDQLFDNEQYSIENSRPIINDFKSHFITREIHQIIHSGGCTITLDKSVEDEDIDVKAIAFSSVDSAWHRVYRENGEWFDEPANNIPIIAVSHYGLGKVAAIGNLSLFSTFHDAYGIYAADNFKLITNIISWLLNKAYSKESKLTLPIFITIPIEQDLFYWIKGILEEGKWSSIQETVNHALKALKINSKIRENDD